MGNVNNVNAKYQYQISTKIKQLIKKKHKGYFKLQKKVLNILKEHDQIFKLDSHLRELFYWIKKSSSQDFAITFSELENYLFSILQIRENDKQLLKQRRKQFFNFAKQNLCKNSDFILTKVLYYFTLSAQVKCQIFLSKNLQEIKIMISSLFRVTQQIIKWFYGEQIIDSLCTNENDEQANDGIKQIYFSELTEFIIFFDPHHESPLYNLRQKQIQIMHARIKNNVFQTVQNLKNIENIRKQYLFPKQNQDCYSSLLQYIEKVAKASLFTSKYKFICIIFQTIPILYWENALRKSTKSSEDNYKSTLSTQKNIQFSEKNINKNIQLQNNISQLLSTQSKRQIAKYLLIEWYKNTQCNILKDILIPLKILSEQVYLKQNNSSPLLAFLYAIYEVVGVNDLQNSEFC